MSGSTGNSWILTADGILSILLIFLTTHLLFSSLGLVPSEVSVFNNEVSRAVSQFGTIHYEREMADTLRTATASSRGLPEATTSRRSLPEPPEEKPADLGQPPQRIIIDKINVNAPISNPGTADISVLDSALKEGVVRYPSSGGLGGNRPMFLFGHSSRLPAPAVQNEAYRSFNGLGDLSVGDTVTVEGGDQAVKYSVSSVQVVDEDEALVDFSTSGNTLTLSTCTTFGSKQNRTVVTAKPQK